MRPATEYYLYRLSSIWFVIAAILSVISADVFVYRMMNGSEGWMTAVIDLVGIAIMFGLIGVIVFGILYHDAFCIACWILTKIGNHGD